MFGKKQKEEMRFILWYGEKVQAGGIPTPEETQRMFEARERTKVMAKYLFGLRPDDYAYTEGEGFGDAPG
jgi:hypothetical protein